MAAPFQNFGNFTVPTPVAANPAASPTNRIPSRQPLATPPWGSSFLKDLFYREDVRSSIMEEYFYGSALVNSGIIQRNAELDGRSGGVTVEYPFWIAGTFEEEDVDSSEYWGASGQGYLTPQKMTTSKFVIPRVSKGFAFAADQIGKIVSGEDPMAAFRAYIASNLNTFRTRYLLTMFDAFFSTGGPLVGQKLTAAAPAAATPTAAESISVTQVVQAMNLLSERSNRLTTIFMHSHVYHWLLHQGMLQFSSPAGVGTGSAIEWGGGGIGVSNADFAYFSGLRVVVDDQIKPVAGTSGAPQMYPVYLAGPGAVQEGVQREFSIEMDRNILSGPQDIAAAYYIYGLGVPGISWVGTNSQVAAGSINAATPTLPAVAYTPVYPRQSDISTPSNWTLAWQQRELIPLVRLETYTPFGLVSP